MTVEIAIEAAPAAPKEPLAVEAVEKSELRVLNDERRRIRSQLSRFKRGHAYHAKHLPELLKESPEEKMKPLVKNCYGLFRLFCFSYNFINLGAERGADRASVPADFESELKEVLTSAYFSKFEEAIRAKKEDFEKELPEEVSTEVAEKLMKFVSVKEADQINAKYNDKLAELTEKIDAIRKEKGIEISARPKRVKKAKSPRSPAAKGDSLEDQLVSVLKEVKKRTEAVRFAKDDFASLSEAQSQLDNLF